MIYPFNQCDPKRSKTRKKPGFTHLPLWYTKVLPNRAPFFQNSWYIWFSFLVHTVDFWYVSLVRGLFRYARLVHIFVYWTKIGTCTRNDTCTRKNGIRTRKMGRVPHYVPIFSVQHQICTRKISTRTNWFERVQFCVPSLSTGVPKRAWNIGSK